MSSMQATINLQEKMMKFANRSARAWQNYFDATGLLPNITLSPEQISVVQQEEDHMLINGSAGSGKSLTLLYKLLKIMDQENEHRKILYCSFNTTLIEDAKKRLSQSEKYHQIKDKHMLHLTTFHNAAAGILRGIGLENSKFVRIDLANLHRYEDHITGRTIVLMDNYLNSKEHENLPDGQQLYKTHAGKFLMEEILWMKANGFITEDQYLDCKRDGRGSNPRLTKEQRKTIIHLYKEYHQMLKDKFHDHLDLEDYALEILKYSMDIPDSLKYDYIFVDEVQDLQAMQLKALVTLHKRSIVVSGDPKQRIYKRSPFSYRELGLNIEGRRNKNLKTNYRSTKQIMQLANSIKFIDEENDRMDDQKFVREGEKPVIQYFAKSNLLSNHIISEVKRIREQDPGATIAVIHRHAIEKNKVNQCPVFAALTNNFDVITTSEYAKRFDFNSIRKPVFYTDAFSVKGLEFDYVFLINFDRDHYPNKKRMEELDIRSNNKHGENYDNDFDIIFNDEKKVLYVAITRAKKNVQILYTGQTFKSISQFVRDFHRDDFTAKNFDVKIYCQ